MEDFRTYLNNPNKNFETRFQINKINNLLYQLCSKSFNSEPQPLSQGAEDLYNSIAQYFGYDNLYIFGPRKR